MVVEIRITITIPEDEEIMPLFLNNDEIEQLITMRDTMESLETLYREMGEGTAVTAPRSDVQITGFVNNIGMGAQFAAVGKKVYDAAVARGFGRDVLSDWFTQDVHP